jgi:hypothetical protein
VGSGRSKVKDVRSIGALLDRLSDEGAWVQESIQQDLRKLADNRQDVAHFRPYHRQKSRRPRRAPDGIVIDFKGSLLVEPKRLEQYAEHALTTMVDLWTMPIVTFPPGTKPPKDSPGPVRSLPSAPTTLRNG